MKILDFFHKETININLQSQNKKEVLDELALPVSQITDIKHDEIVRVLLERERLGSTGIGGGIGIPHGKLKSLDKLIIGFGLSRRGIGFESIDGLPTHIFFLLLAPENSTALHLRLLAQISKLLKDDSFKDKLMRASSNDEIITIINENDFEFE